MNYIYSGFMMPRDISSIPLHVAIIPDGNGRWAWSQQLHRHQGHKAGAANARDLLSVALEEGIRYLSLFCFSSENWDRPVDEVESLMQLVNYYLEDGVDDFVERGIRLQVIGSRRRLEIGTVAAVEKVEKLTASCNRLHLALALDYGGRWDICQAARRVVERVSAGEIVVDDIDEEMFVSHLTTLGIPDPDLLIRTGGEVRLSNFLLWQLGYSELIFLDKNWPNFGREDFMDCLHQYARRSRRFGKSPA